VYSAIYICPNCQSELRVPYRGVYINVAFVFSRHTHCPRCGTANTLRSARRDSVDSLSHHPLSWIQHLLWAPLYHCIDCRLQYYDWRQLEPMADPQANQPKTPQANDRKARSA
jgi:hypothetical protein